MKVKTLFVLVMSFFVTLGTIFFPALGQEGHPMSGSWVGDWGLTAQDRNRVVIILEWVGTELVGTINPGPNAIPLKTARANPDDWSLHAEADGLDAAGRSVSYTLDGSIDDLGTYNRTIAGTWKVGNNTGDFSITRQ